MRTQAILLVRDTVVVLGLRPTEGEPCFIHSAAISTNHVLWSQEAQLAFWRRSCDLLVVHLDSYAQALLSNLQRFQELGDKSGAGIIRDSCINCLAHLAILCENLCQMDPTLRTELNTLCDSALERLSERAQDMRTGEYTRLDLLLGVCHLMTAGSTADNECSIDIFEKGVRGL